MIANERRDRLELLAAVVSGLGHEIVAREVAISEVAPATARLHPDVALVGLGDSLDHALGLIDELVHEASCPVIAVLHASDPSFVREAARRGVFACLTESSPDDLQGAIEVTLQRFAEYRGLQGAFARRATIEQAKGILMARYALDADDAFARLRAHSQQSGVKLADVAAAIVESHLLLRSPPVPPGT